jgi:hypothetical protein
MLIDADLPESYWNDTLVYAALLHNVTPTRAVGDVTPKEAWSGNKPDVSRIHVFGSRAFVHILDVQRTKLAAKSLVCHFLGYARTGKAYRIVYYCPTRRFLRDHSSQGCGEGPGKETCARVQDPCHALIEVVQRFNCFCFFIEKRFQQGSGKCLPRDWGGATGHMNEHVWKVGGGAGKNVSAWERPEDVRQPRCGAVDALGHPLLRVRTGHEGDIGEGHEDIGLRGQDMVPPFVRRYLGVKKMSHAKAGWH